LKPLGVHVLAIVLVIIPGVNAALLKKVATLSNFMELFNTQNVSEIFNPPQNFLA